MRKKLIFFANSDPGVNPGNIRNAYHYALVGLKAGLETEVRLAADAVKIVLPDGILDNADGRELRDKMREGATRKLFVSF